MLMDQTLAMVLRQAHNIAVVGAKDKTGSPVDRVGCYLIEQGYRLLPVHAVRKSVWGIPCVKSLEELPINPDIVCIFKAAEYCPGHAQEALRLKVPPQLFWMQEGICSPEAGKILAGSGIGIIENLCLMTEHQRLLDKFDKKDTADCSEDPADAVFICQRCGTCCCGQGGIVIGPSDATRLSAHTSLGVEEMLRTYAYKRQEKYYLRSGDDGNCIFFNQSIGCGIHEARPNICRAWPFFRGNLIDKISFEMAREDCPGITPDVPHSEFTRIGFDYLQRHKLLAADPLREAAALFLGADNLSPKNKKGKRP